MFKDDRPHHGQHKTRAAGLGCKDMMACTTPRSEHEDICAFAPMKCPMPDCNKAGVTSCPAETDRVKGLGVMLFHIEGTLDDLVQTCAKVGSLEGMLEWSVGCSWQKPPYFSRMYWIKSELKELSFMFAYPEEHAEIKNRVEALRVEQVDVVLEAKKVLHETISRDRFLGYMTADIKVTTRSRELYSIFKTIGDQKISADEIRDIAQSRIVLNLKPSASVGHLCNVQQVCYHVMGLVHAMWPPLPQTMKDYIATPKPNGYQSLHTTVMPFGTQIYFPFEIQAKRRRMGI